MSTFLQLTVTGLANGAVLALAALGFVLIYKSTGVINFSQGSLLLLGAYAVYASVVSLGLHWGLGITLTIGLAVAFGIGVERVILRRMVGESAISVIMITIGLASIMQALVEFVWGTKPRNLPHLFPESVLTVGGIGLPTNRLWAVGIAAVALIGFGVFFQFSRHGVAMRSVADDQQAALLMGISVRRVFAMAWALAAVSAVIAGLLLANIGGLSGNIAGFGLLVFPVVIVGGLDSISGAVVGGALIGLISAYTSGYLHGSVFGLTLSGLQDVVPYLVLVLVLLVKPYGLFGQVRIERV